MSTSAPSRNHADIHQTRQLPPETPSAHTTPHLRSAQINRAKPASRSFKNPSETPSARNRCSWQNLDQKPYICTELQLSWHRWIHPAGKSLIAFGQVMLQTEVELRKGGEEGMRRVTERWSLMLADAPAACTQAHWMDTGQPGANARGAFGSACSL